MNELFSERLKAARRNAGYKANAFAVLCGISASYLSELESGKRSNPANLLVEKFANECSVTVDWLLGRDDLPNFVKGVNEVAKGSGVRKGSTSLRGLTKLEKGHEQGECRYPEGCDLAGELSSVRERLAGVEGDLAYMRTQLDTVVGLLGHALGGTMDKARPREGEKRKAG
jgi:transcriptional regulator with XRE-family HTH domain